mmetsp:Transcript_7217/g.12183  ORF Transcript_7217/g.12183 Transcript_7217/m.12183 type:complete len:249 (-) Transcript_7217:330-1076(-)
MKGYWAQRIAWYPAGCFGPYRTPDRGYSRREIAADAAVHLIGVVLGSIGVVALLFRTLLHKHPPEVVVAVAVYSLALLSMLFFSAAFNMLVTRWPKHVWALQLADHAGILLLIAGSYTPFMVVLSCTRMLAFVWTAGLVSFVAKASRSALDLLVLHVCCFLSMGWAALAVWDKISMAAPPWALRQVLLGGALYTIGMVPWSFNALEFHNALWHVFVLVASGIFYQVILCEIAGPSAGDWSTDCNLARE